MTYTAPIRDWLFVLEEIAGIDAIAGLPGYGDATPDLVRSVLEEAGKFAGGVLAPLNRIGDEQGARLENGVDRKSTRLNSSHLGSSYAVFCLKKKRTKQTRN